MGGKAMAIYKGNVVTIQPTRWLEAFNYPRKISVLDPTLITFIQPIKPYRA